jgi:hypothetical protein
LTAVKLDFVNSTLKNYKVGIHWKIDGSEKMAYACPSPTVLTLVPYKQTFSK